MGIIQLLVLIAIIRLLIQTENPILCATLYMIVSLIFGFASGPLTLSNLIPIGIEFGWNLVWFALLVRFMETGMWWVVFGLGFLGPGLVYLVFE